MHDLDTSNFAGAGELELDPGEAEQEEDVSAQASLGEADETELAGELLSLGGEAELEQFLGDLLKSAARAVGSFVKSPPPVLKNALLDIAKKTLPQLGSAVGGMIGGSTGAQLGGTLAAKAGKAFGLELEGLSSEDREFEVARHYIRFASDAAKNYCSKPPGADPTKAAQSALVKAARRYAPGLVGVAQKANGAQSMFAARAESGRWVRRGGKLILFGV